MLHLTLPKTNYEYLWKIAKGNKWSIASTIVRVTQALDDYKNGRLSATEYLRFINNL